MKANQKKLALVVSFVLTLVMFGTSQIQTNRFKKFESDFVQTKATKIIGCNNPNGLSLNWKNTSSQSMDLYIGIQRKDGTWKTETRTNIAPGQSLPVDLEFCKSNGVYKWWARPSAGASEFPFPDKESLHTK